MATAARTRRARRPHPDRLPVSREDRLDTQRRQSALRREADALHDQLGRPNPHDRSQPTAVLVHRKPWLHDRLQEALGQRGIAVVGHADDGADGSGMTIALSPRLLLLEAQLPSMTGAELARRASRCSPDTIITAQVSHDHDRPPLIQAGATRLWVRGVLPVVIATDIAALLTSG